MTQFPHARAILAAACSISLIAAGASVTQATTGTGSPPSEWGTAPAATADLLISEYIEGSSNNKALEIYNGTDATVDLSAYAVQNFANGATSPTTTALEGTLAPGAVYVYANSQWALAYEPDQKSGDAAWNGDDAVVLVKGPGGAVVDSLGQVGVDPGDAWGTLPTTTKDATLVRAPDVCAGDTVVDDAFDPAIQWAGLPKDNISDLGSHTADCGGGSVPEGAVINEFSASTTGTDVEYLEVYGAPDTDYSALTVIAVEGDVNSPSLGMAVSSHPVGTTDDSGLWLQDLASNTLQNGTQSLLLVAGYNPAHPVVDADKDGVIDDDVVWTLVDSVAVDDGDAGDLTYGPVSLTAEYDGLPMTPGGASRIPDGVDTDTADDWVRNDFDLAGIPGFDGTPVPGEAYNTPGAPNEAVPLPPPGGSCGDPVTLIGAVQGDTDTSPLEGGDVSVEATVIGDFQDGGFDGYYVQDAGDDDAATSDGIFVYSPGGIEVQEGDQVRVSGTVAEHFGMTQIVAGEVLVCAVGGQLPEATAQTLPLVDPEAHEGMRVSFAQELTISEYYGFARYGEIVLTIGRQFQPTALADPYSAEAVQIRDTNAAERITLDDGRSVQNPDPAIHPNGAEFTLDNLFRGGDLVANATGVLDYRFDLWRIQPTQGADYTPTNPRPVVPEVGGSLHVASFNVLNYFTTLGSRGAETPEEFDRQEAKIVSALGDLDADVVGLIEIENNDDVALATLTDALNDEVGAGTYDYIATGVVGSDAITTAFIYKPSTVTPVGDFATLTTADDPRFLDDYNRPALAQTFEENATSGQLTVSINHLKSKGSSCEAAGDPTDPWAGNCNGVRTDAAEALADWLAADPTGTGADDVLLLGDLNSYDHEDPIDALVDGGFTDLVKAYQGEEAYSYVFDGMLGYLDYAMGNDAAAQNVTGVDTWHINADEPSILDYTMAFKKPPQDALYAPDPYRSSDHDPVLVGLDLEGTSNPAVVERIAGSDRYATAAEIALRYQGDPDVVYLASGANYPDALAGTPVAVVDEAPILLTRPDRLPAATRDALLELSPQTVVILGGTASISDTVAGQVASTGADVERVAGQDRYATAADVARRLDADVEIDTVYVASGQRYADALSAGPLAGLGEDPILLTRTASLPAATRDALTELAPDHIVVLGGEASVSLDVMAELRGYAPTVERLAGGDRYETGALVAARIPDSDEAYVASGRLFPDALSGGAYAGHQGAPLLLTDPLRVPGATADVLTDRDPEYVGIFGGEASVSEAVRLQIVALLAD